MPIELVEKKFNAMLWRMNSIETVDAALETKLRVAFQEGVVQAQEYVIEKSRGILER